MGSCLYTRSRPYTQSHSTSVAREAVRMSQGWNWNEDAPTTLQIKIPITIAASILGWNDEKVKNRDSQGRQTMEALVAFVVPR